VEALFINVSICSPQFVAILKFKYYQSGPSMTAVFPGCFVLHSHGKSEYGFSEKYKNYSQVFNFTSIYIHLLTSHASKFYLCTLEQFLMQCKISMKQCKNLPTLF
jgi:hypothetical protein